MGENGAVRPAKPRIDVWAALKAGLLAVFTDFNTFFAGAWIWTLAIYAAGVAGGFFAAILGHPERAEEIGNMAGAVPYIAGSIAFAVGWHRHVLFGEKVTNTSMLRFGGREWRFLLFFIPLAVMVAAVTFLLQPILYALASGAAVSDLAWKDAGSVLLAIVLLSIQVRLSFFAPLAAVDIPGDILTRSWRLTGGNGLRIFAGIFLLTVIFLIPRAADTLAFIAAMNRGGGLLTFTVFSLIGNLINFAFIAVTAGFMSHALAQIAGWRLPLSAADARSLDLERASR